MEWIDAVSEAIQYMEDHITEDLTVDMVARHVNISTFYFQKGFAMLCGATTAEYLRNRRLSLAGRDKIIEIALKFGYNFPDSFTRAFTRFHGVTPSAARKGQVTLRTFAPLKVKLSLEGGYFMDYRIEKKEAFTVIGRMKTFTYEEAKRKVPQFWNEECMTGHNQTMKGMYGINIDETMGNDTFTYLIADPYDPAFEVPAGLVTKVIPSFTWAVFPCRGALQDVNVKIFSKWLPALKEYEFAAGYCVEYYADPAKYEKGTMDADYECEIWIPVKKKLGK